MNEEQTEETTQEQWFEYERRKKILSDQNLSCAEYDIEIRKIIDELNL